MSYDLEDEEPQEPKSTPKTAQPMPRLWKTEPEPTEEESRVVRKLKGEPESEPAKKSADSKRPAANSKSKSAKAKEPPEVDENGEKRVLLEETPTFDTYETRRRARLIMGTLIVACILLSGWSFYRVFLYDPVGFIVTDSPEPAASQPGPDAPQSLDQEARFMYNRAQEFAKTGRADQAMAMLQRVVKVYKGTPSARDSKAALDRVAKNLPLFSDSPLVIAQSEAPKTAVDPAPPPAIIDASRGQPQAEQGQATLVLPANPAETPVTPPPSQPKMAPSVTPTVSHKAPPSGFQANLDAGVHESGWPFVIVGDRDGAPMMLIPGGTFMMGASDGQPAEAPPHQVHLAAFYIDQHEVTNRQFRIFLSESHYHGQPAGKWLTDDKIRAEPENAPVAHVSFRDAESFASWANKQIPTEAQWEMAARSTDGRRYPWGDDAAKWSQTRAFRQIDPVMSFPEDKSPYGIFDMAGNVQEWTRDVYDPKYYHLLAKTIADNPTGPPSRARNAQHVVRGAAKNWSVTYREGVPADRRLPYLGFRCVLMVEAQGLVPPTNPGQPATAPPSANPGAQPPAPPPF
jgi:formylglycine-generating enzyme